MEQTINFLYEDKTKLKSEYISYLFNYRIGTFRFGSFPGKISSTKISDNWMEFLTIANKTNDDWKVIMEKYKDNKNAFIYLDPPYFNICNNIYTEYDDKKIYIDIVDYLKILNVKYYSLLIKYNHRIHI